MKYTYGDVSTLGDLHWYLLELRSEKTVEPTLRRLMAAIPSIFNKSPIEIFTPTSTRELAVFELTTLNCIFVRSPDFRQLLRLKSVTGVSGLVTSDDSHSPSKAMRLDNGYVQELISAAFIGWAEKANSLQIGSFVRILDGEPRDWCGHITHIHDGQCIVEVQLKTKKMLVETPVRNLIDLSHVPEHLRTFYFCDLVKELAHQDLTHLIQEDLHYKTETQCVDDPYHVTRSSRLGRQQTVTALVKRLITMGQHDPQEISRQVLGALKSGSIRKPRSLAIVHGVIKTHLIRDHFAKLNPEIRNYNQVVKLFGSKYKFSIRDLAACDPDQVLPATSKESHA